MEKMHSGCMDYCEYGIGKLSHALSSIKTVSDSAPR
jgi:hypothetical protein